MSSFMTYLESFPIVYLDDFILHSWLWVDILETSIFTIAESFQEWPRVTMTRVYKCSSSLIRVAKPYLEAITVVGFS